MVGYGLLPATHGPSPDKIASCDVQSAPSGVVHPLDPHGYLYAGTLLPALAAATLNAQVCRLYITSG